MEELIKDIEILEKEVSEKIEELKQEYIKFLIEKKQKEGAKAAIEHFAEKTPQVLNDFFKKSWIQHNPIAEYVNDGDIYDRHSIIEYSGVISSWLWEYNYHSDNLKERDELMAELIDMNTLSMKLDSLLSEKTKEELFFDELFNILIATIKDHFSYQFDW